MVKGPCQLREYLEKILSVDKWHYLKMFGWDECEENPNSLYESVYLHPEKLSRQQILKLLQSVSFCHQCFIFVNLN